MASYLDAIELVTQLPVALVVVDMEGVVRLANPRAAELIEAETREELEGRPVWQLVDSADVPDLAAAFEPRPEFGSTVLGPVSVRVRTNSGGIVLAKCWARVLPPDACCTGYVVTLAPESTLDLVAAAMRESFAGTGLGAVFDALAESAQAFPLSGVGSILIADDGTLTDVHGTWPFPAEHGLRHPGTPWHEVLAPGRAGGTWPVDALPPAVARLAKSHGFGAVWIEPIDVAGERTGAFVVWRRTPLTPFVPQLTSLREVASAAAVAHSQDAHRLELQQAALDDHLTGVGNRARLEARIRHPAPQPCGVMFIDLDFFKQVNDRHGHLMGDRVLKVAAERLTRLVRPQDAVYRVGGDEFVVVCGSSRDVASARQVAERMAKCAVDAIGAPFEIDGTSVTVGASVGVAVAEAGTSLDQALDQADDALLAAKRAGRGRSATAG